MRIHRAFWVPLLLSFCIGLALPQPPDTLWTRTFGGGWGDGAMCVRQTRDGGFIAAGYTRLTGRPRDDAWLIRLNADGDSVWSRTYGGPAGGEIASSVLETADCGFVLTAFTFTESDTAEALLIRTNSQGDTLWTRRYVHNVRNVITSVQPTYDGGYILAGYSQGLGSGRPDGWLICTDAAGDTLWTRSLGSADYELFNEAYQTFDGGFVAVGSRGIRGCYWLFKTDEGGDSLWSRMFFSSWYTSAAQSVQQTADSGLVVVGCGDASSGSGLDIWLIKTDANGDSLWSHTFRRPGDDVAHCVRIVRDGGFVMAAGTAFYEPTGIRVLRTDRNGDSLWELAYDDIEGHAAWVEPTVDGGYILAGYVYPTGSGTADAWFARLAPEFSQVEGLPLFQPLSFAFSICPNPFNFSTRIEFTLPSTQRVSLRLYDVLGREVAVLMDEIQTAGQHEMTFDASGLPSGVYMCRLEAGGMAQTRKMVLLK